MVKRKTEFKIYGRIINNDTGEGLPNLIVTAADKDLLIDDLLGAVATDVNGNYEIVYDKKDFRELFFDQKPDIYLIIKTQDGKIIHSTKEKVRYEADKTEEFNISISPGDFIEIPKTFNVEVLRPEDMLQLDFKFINLKIQDGKLVLDNSEKPAYIVVGFPPQNIAEEAFFEEDNDNFPIIDDEDPDYDSTNSKSSETPKIPAQTRLSQPSRLVFIVPKDAEIVYSSEGLLEACSKYELNLAPTALPPLFLHSRKIAPSQLSKRINILEGINFDNFNLKRSSTTSNSVSSDKLNQIDTQNSGKSAKEWIARSSLKKYLPHVYDEGIRKQIAKNYWEVALAKLPPQLRKPTGIETSIEAPYRLILSPNRFAAWVHALKPVISTDSKRTELWHTRHALKLDRYLFRWEDVPGDDSERLLKYLVEDLKITWALNATIEKDNEGKTTKVSKEENLLKFELNEENKKVILKLSSTETYEYIVKKSYGKSRIYIAEINEEEENLRTVRAIWTRDPGFNKDDHNDRSQHYPPEYPPYNPFRMSLDSFDRHNIVHLSANYNILKYSPQPIQVNRFMLTSLGAWMHVRGAWNPTGALSVEEWQHRGTMGRDHYVRVVYKGYLFPFGHRASLIKVTERKFHPEITFLLWAAGHHFAQKIDSEVKSIDVKSQPEIKEFIRNMNDNFENIITSLVESIEGKSSKEIDSLVKESERRFHDKTVSGINKTKDKFKNDLAKLANTAKDEFRLNTDSIIGVIEDKSFPDVPGNIAYLRQRMFIVVREPEKIYINANLNNDFGHSYDRQMPFSSVRITTLVTPNLDDPIKSDFDTGDVPSSLSPTGQSLFWPKVSENYFQFHLVAEDFAGNQAEFKAPLVFAEQSILNYEDNNSIPVESKYNDVKKLLEVVRDDYQEDVNPKMEGQSVMYADGGDDFSKTTFETHSITFSAEIPNFEIAKQYFRNKDIPPFYPKVHETKVLIPSIKHLAGNNQSATIQYYNNYLMNGFGTGEVFVTIDGIDLDFNSQGDRAGGLVKPNLQITGLSRRMGPVSSAGDDLSKIDGGTFDPEDFFKGLDAKIFGVINLWDIIQLVGSTDFLNNLEKIPKLVTDTTQGKLEVKFEWSPKLKDWANIFIARNGNTAAELNINAKLLVQSSGETDIDISCTLNNFSIDLIGNIESFIIIRFDQIKFISKSGKKADVDVKMADIEFVGVLAFVETLKDLIPLDGFSDPPYIDVTAKGISAGFTLGLPNLAVGVFSLENLSLGAGFTIPFIGDPLSIRFNFCERQSPFLLTVSMFGGGGFFAITLDPKGVQMLEASFEFGASLSVNFGVASGGVYVMAGIYFKMQMNPDKAELTGYFRMGGEVDVLGIISVSIELYLSLKYEFSSGKCVGKATLTIEVEILFFSVSVEISCERKFAGSNGDPSFKELMEPYTDLITGQEVKPWEVYCKAFA